MTNLNHEYLTTKEAAEFLKFSAGTLRVWRSQSKNGERKGPPFRVADNGDVRYIKSELQIWASEYFKKND